MKTERQNGFSLIELLIVIVVIALLATLAGAGFLAARRSANEGSTISSLRVLHNAQTTFASSFGGGEFAGNIGGANLDGLTTLSSLELIDPVLGSGIKSGYTIVGGREVASPTSPAQFFFSSIPISIEPLVATGHYRYGIATDGIIRKDENSGSHFLNVVNVATASPLGN